MDIAHWRIIIGSDRQILLFYLYLFSGGRAWQSAIDVLLYIWAASCKNRYCDLYQGQEGLADTRPAKPSFDNDNRICIICEDNWAKFYSQCHTKRRLGTSQALFWYGTHRISMISTTEFNSTCFCMMWLDYRMCLMHGEQFSAWRDDMNQQIVTNWSL